MTIEEYNICVNQIGPSVLRFVNSNLNNIDASKDIVQESFLVLWKKREEIVIEKAKSYLFSTAHHKLIDFIRSKKNTTNLENVIFHTDSQYNEYSNKNLVKYALSKLSFEQRELITLRDLEGYDYKEIEQITGYSESKVKVTLFRARKELKSIISKLEVSNAN